jgi:hypothetical protein
MKLDRELQTYLAHYFTTQEDDGVSGGDFDPELGKATPEQLADFEKRKADKLTNTPLKADYFPSDDDDFKSLMESGLRADDINPDDVPFN